jgi:hypothetical protein
MSPVQRRNQVLFQFAIVSVVSIYGHSNLAESPIIAFTDSSFQDCPDSSRSTGGYLIYIRGAVIDVTSTMPSIIARSTCEAEYTTCSRATMAATYIRKVFNELHVRDTDYPLSIPIGIDSQSAIDTAQSTRETQRTRHIARRYHFTRVAIGNSQIVLFKLDGSNNSRMITCPWGILALRTFSSIIVLTVFSLPRKPART